MKHGAGSQTNHGTGPSGQRKKAFRIVDSSCGHVEIYRQVSVQFHTYSDSYYYYLLLYYIFDYRIIDHYLNNYLNNNNNYYDSRLDENLISLTHSRLIIIVSQYSVCMR